jgi:hypothetical protein
MSETRIDTRDLAERLEELESRDADVYTSIPEEPLDEDERAELAELQILRNDVSEFDDGATLIREDDFESYARELAEDIGAIPLDASWPLTCIGWEQAAQELAHDYSTVTYDGEHWFYRA